ncbi:MAG: TonB-dependent receptor [Bacteroidota bacterium]
MDSRQFKFVTLLVCLLAGWVGIAFSSMRGTTGILEGRVRDKNTHEPLIAVNVQIVGTGFGAVSDVEGRYQISNIRAGIYDVRLSIIGYTPVVVKEITVLPDLRTKLDVEMTQSSVEMAEVEIIAEKPLIQKDQAATAYSFSGLIIEKLPVSSFQDVLTLQPGVTMEGNVRGGRVGEVVYMVDGIPVQDVISGGLGANLPKSAIAGLTVHTGGFEAEYGNAMSGVVNVITKTGSDRHDLNVRFEKDNWVESNKQTDHLSELEVTAKGPISPGELYYFTANTVTLSDTRWWQDFQNFFSSPVLQDYSGIAKVELATASTFRLSLQGIYSIRRWRDYEFSWRYDLPGLPPRLRDSYRITMNASDAPSENSFYSLSLSRYYQRNRIGDLPKDVYQFQAPYQYDFYLQYIVEGSRNWWSDARQLIYTLKGDYTMEIEHSHLVKMGVEFNQYDIHSDLVKLEPQTTYFGKPRLDVPMLNYSNEYQYYPRSGSVFIQDKIQIERDGSILTAGLRWDFLDPTSERPMVEYIPTQQNEYRQVVTGTTKASFKHQFSPRISFAAPVGVSSFYYLNVGYYFQFPLFDYLYSGTSPVQIKQGVKNVQAGNPDLQPERTIAWETGLKQGLDRNHVVSFTYFVKKTTNQIDTKTLIAFDSKYAGDYGFASYINNAEASAKGVEIVLSRESGEFVTGSLSYTYMRAEGVSEVADQSLNYAQWGFPVVAEPYPLSWDQRHSVKLDVDAKLLWDMRLNTIFLYNSAKPYTYFPTRDGFTASDPNMVFQPNNARMQDVLFVNLKFSADFRPFKWQEILVTLYADVRNVFNKRNVRWMDSSGRIGGELSDPSAYYDPRRARIGLKLQF